MRLTKAIERYLLQFCDASPSRYYPSRYYMHRPWTDGGYLYVTDGRICLRMPYAGRKYARSFGDFPRADLLNWHLLKHKSGWKKLPKLKQVPVGCSDDGLRDGRIAYPIGNGNSLNHWYVERLSKRACRFRLNGRGQQISLRIDGGIEGLLMPVAAEEPE